MKIIQLLIATSVLAWSSLALAQSVGDPPQPTQPPAVQTPAPNPAPPPDMPRFRAGLSEVPPPSLAPFGTVRLLAEPDYAPWSFTLANGTMAGISVDLALLACEESAITCEVLPTAYTSLVPTLTANGGDAIISGLRVSDELARVLSPTKPYFKSLGQFAVRSGANFPGADPRGLAGLRVGYVKGTVHAKFVERYFTSSTLVPIDSEARLFEDLRTGVLDAAFGDSFRLMFWMNGEKSRNCCVPLEGPFIDTETITRPLVFLTRPESTGLRDRLDVALDRLEQSGTTAEVFSRYLPYSFWPSQNPTPQVSQ